MNVADEINAHFDAAANRVRLQALADQHLADNRARSSVERPNVQEVIDLLAATHDMTGQAVIDMLESFDYTEARVRHEVAA